MSPRKKNQKTAPTPETPPVPVVPTTIASLISANPQLQGANSPTSVKEVTARVRENQAVQLRIGGATFEAIGDALGITHEGARKAVKRALERTGKEIEDGTNLLRELERQRLERLILSTSPAAYRGVLGAVDQVRKLSESIRTLMNLDMAGTKITFDGTLNVEGLKQILDLVYGAPKDAANHPS